MTRTAADAPERATLSCPVRPSALPDRGLDATFEADERAREGLAAFLGILAVERLTAEYRVRRSGRAGVLVTGRLRAALVQESVVTLDPVRQTVDEEIELRFRQAEDRPARRREESTLELALDPEAEDEPEPYTGDTIELGDSFREILALALDPYPRGDGIDFDGLDTDPDPNGRAVSPFAALGQRKGAPDD